MLFNNQNKQEKKKPKNVFIKRIIIPWAEALMCFPWINSDDLPAISTMEIK